MISVDGRPPKAGDPDGCFGHWSAQASFDVAPRLSIPELCPGLPAGHIAFMHDPGTGQYLVLLEGKPAAGKTSVGKTAAARGIPGISMVHLSAGDTLRDIASGKSDSSHTKELQVYQDALARHEVLPHDVVETVIEEAIGKLPQKVILVDGYPRDLEQLKGFEAMIKRLGRKVVAIVNVHAPDDVVRQRMLNRPTRHSENPYTEQTVDARLARYHDYTDPAFATLAIDLGIERSQIVTNESVESSADSLRVLIADALRQEK